MERPPGWEVASTLQSSMGDLAKWIEYPFQWPLLSRPLSRQITDGISRTVLQMDISVAISDLSICFHSAYLPQKWNGMKVSYFAKMLSLLKVSSMWKGGRKCYFCSRSFCYVFLCWRTRWTFFHKICTNWTNVVNIKNKPMWKLKRSNIRFLLHNLKQFVLNVHKKAVSLYVRYI